MDEGWTLGGVPLRSRVLLGTASYPTREVMLAAIEAAGSEVVTVSLRRVSAESRSASLYADLTARSLRLLPNTAGCLTARDAVRTAALGREALETAWVKLEVIADDETLLPDGEELLEAASQLVRDGFVVLAYTNDDVVLARKLQDVGCAAVMPLAAPIGTGLGVQSPHALAMIRHYLTVPMIVDAGLGTAWHVAQAMELGADAVLLNTAVARADDPVRMARAGGLAAAAGFHAARAGRIPERFMGRASSPTEGVPWRRG